MDIIIRSVSPKDISGAHAVHQASIRALQKGPYPKKMIYRWADSISGNTLQDEMNNPEMIGFVGESAGRIIGFAALKQQTVRALYVHPDYQKRGIGSMLLDRLEIYAAKKGLHRLKLNASLNAGTYYEGRGYRVVRETPFVFSEKVRLNSLEMIKDII